MTSDIKALHIFKQQFLLEHGDLYFCDVLFSVESPHDGNGT